MPPNSSCTAPPLLKTSSMRRGVAPPPVVPSPHLLSVQRSEFEDFMNAYRPTGPFDQPPPPRAPPHQESDHRDFGRSIKRLMKRAPPQGSPKNPRVREAGSQGSQRAVDPKAPERKAKRPADLVPPQIALAPPEANRVAQNAAPPVPPPPKKSSSAAQPPPKSPTKKTSVPAPQPRAPSPQPKVVAKPRPPPQREEVVVASLPLPAEEKQGRLTAESAEHCLVLAGAGLGRFLPPRHNPDPILSLRVVAVPERKYHVIMEFEEAPPPPRPLTSSSGMMVAPPFDEEEARARDTRDQMSCFHWIRESHVAPMGMLLMNVERISEFPFVTYLMVGGGRQELAQKLKFVGDRPLPDRQDQLRFLAGYEEPVTICRPPPSIPERPSSDRTGFVICLYQVLAGEDQVRLDQNWVTWTGARQIYRTLPPHMGLRRISVHKSLLPAKTVNYVLVCEFAHIMDHLTDACVLIDHLRARCCGFIGIYRVLDAL